MSGLRCWPGALAVVVQANDPSNVGAVVEVLRPYSGEVLEGLRYDNDHARRNGFVWIVHSRRPMRLVALNDPTNVQFVHLTISADCQLRPITPPRGADTTPTTEPLQETA